MIREIEIINMIQSISGINPVKMETSFVELGMDSTGVLELLIEIEVKYNLDVLTNELSIDDLQTVKDLYDFVLRLMNT